MKMIFGLVLAIGVVLAGAAVYMTKGYMAETSSAFQREKKFMADTGGLARVFVVINAKNYGDELRPEDVQQIYWQKNALPEGVFTDAEVLFPKDGPGPRMVLRQIDKFEPILAVKVTEPGQLPGLTGSLEKGMRAFTLEVQATASLQVGDRVDLYWTGVSPGTTGGDTTKTIETALKVIDVDRIDEQSVAKAAMMQRTVTVAVTPEQVARLAQAGATGRLVISIVGVGDMSETAKVEVDGNALLGITPEVTPQPEAMVKAEQEKVCTVRTRKGGEAVEIAIPCTN
jgi:pilus assembly protein CpaB